MHRELAIAKGRVTMSRTSRIWLSKLLAVGALFVAAICTAAQTPTFHVHVLGNISGATAAYVTGINNAGEAVGEVTVALHVNLDKKPELRRETFTA
jgi:hypothetical protein